MKTFSDLGSRVITYSIINLGIQHKYTIDLISLFEELSKIKTVLSTEGLEKVLKTYYEIIDTIAESEDK